MLPISILCRVVLIRFGKFMFRRFQQTLFAETEDLFEQQTAPPLFCRAEALMPRVSIHSSRLFLSAFV